MTNLALKDAIAYLSICIASYLEKHNYMDDIDFWELEAIIVDYSTKVEEDIKKNNGTITLNMMNKHYDICLNEVLKKFVLLKAEN